MQPDGDTASRIIELKRRAPAAGAVVYEPRRSASGKWEAVGPGWTVAEADPGAFADRLEARLDAEDRKAAARSAPSAREVRQWQYERGERLLPDAPWWLGNRSRPGRWYRWWRRDRDRLQDAARRMREERGRELGTPPARLRGGHFAACDEPAEPCPEPHQAALREDAHAPADGAALDVQLVGDEADVEPLPGGVGPVGDALTDELRRAHEQPRVVTHARDVTHGHLRHITGSDGTARDLAACRLPTYAARTRARARPGPRLPLARPGSREGTMDTHPEHLIAARLAELEARAFPAALVYSPLQSVSGKWEAVGDGWTIIEDSPVVFAGKLAKRLDGDG